VRGNNGDLYSTAIRLVQYGIVNGRLAFTQLTRVIANFWRRKPPHANVVDIASAHRNEMV
jgi:hypothetical protein